ncbi:hypothetical protein KKC63_01860 [Patescibacteria group bacterium]|nr:hypothetical protein [Patescibacteria group bacterium]MBU4078124.1 hypothetical protein [Patescibacteria group bacterium]
MINQELANILFEIGYFLEMEEAAFRPQAYEKAAIALENLKESVFDIYKKGGVKELEKIPGVGKSIAKKIEEYIKTGKIKYYDKWKKKVPIDIDTLMAINGVGAKSIKIFYQKLGITSLKDLENAAKEHKIALLIGFGEKTEKNILENIALFEKSKKRFIIEKILPTAKDIRAKLNKLKEVKKVVLAGSIRRKGDTVGDIDILVVTNSPKKVMDYFTTFSEVARVWGKGETKSSVRLKQGINCDLRIVPKESYGAALMYFTGSKDYNIKIRKHAISKGLKLNEYGLFKGKKMLAGRTEKEIYKKLELDFVSPEKRDR